MTPGRRTFGCALCAGMFMAASQLSRLQAANMEFVAPGYKPAGKGDERSLWHVMDQAEAELKLSRFVVRDAALNAYLKAVACKLAQDYCPDVRVYLIRTAQFNASMAPNGMMQVWTGLLLRCVDEAQLAAIIGHEMGHYLRRHTLARWRDVRGKSDFGAFLGLGLSVAGLGPATIATNMLLVASTYAFSRDQEREADEIGMELMKRAGYAPMAAAEVWEQLISEFNAATAQRSKQLFFATHPEPEERLTTLRKAAEASGAGAGERDRERYLEKIGPVRGLLIADELNLRQYGRSEVVFDRLLAQQDDDGALWFAKGEVFRLRAGADDGPRARQAYERALQTGSAPPETYRSLMLVELKAGERDRAQAAFNAYLALRPQAPDAASLRMLLTE